MPIDYEKCTIFRIYCPEKQVAYIGGTAQPLYKRLSNLRRKKDFWECFYEARITELEKFHCYNREQLNHRILQWEYYFKNKGDIIYEH